MFTKKDLLKYKTLMVKSNYIIEASYKLNLQEQRLIYILTTKISKDDTNFKSCRFTQSEINGILSKHKISFNELSQHIDSLRNRELVIVKENSILKTKWLSSAEYFDNGNIELCFDDKLKPYLLQLKDRFTKLSLDKVITFNSNYSCRIYELLKQYESIGERAVTVEALRTMFCIEPDEYKLYGDFKRKVLLQAQNEINNNSDISFDFKEIKTGRKVTSLKFYIKSNIKTQDDISATLGEETSLEPDKIKLVKLIIHEDISDQEASKILNTAAGSINKIKEKYAIVCHLSNVRNIVGAMIKALEQNWTLKSKTKISTFNNYKQRQYNFKELEQQLTAWEDNY